MTRLCLLVALALPTVARALPPELSAAVALGDCTTVTAGLPDPVDDEARLAVGWCLRTSHPDRAAEVTAPLSDGVLAEYGRWVRAQALHAAGRHDDALAALDGVALPGRAGLDVRLLRARILLALERSLDARPDLRALLSVSEVSSEARYLLAVGGRQRGALEATVATFQATWARSTRGPWSERSAQALAELGHPVPDASTEPGRALMATRVEALKDAHRHGEALELLLAIREATGDTTPTRSLAWAFFRGRRYGDAVATWGSLHGPPAEATGPATDLFHHALAASRTGDYAMAAVLYGRVMALHPGHGRADEASYKLGYLHYDAGELDEAIVDFEAHLQRHPRSDMKVSTLWFLGWAHHRLGRPERAFAVWEGLEAVRGGEDLAAGATYWRAHHAAASGDEATARTLFERVLDRWPTTGHAWLAAEALGRTFPARPPVDPPPWPADLADREDVRRATLLAGAGFRGWARDELAGLPGAVQGRREAALAAAHALIAMGDYRTARRLAQPWCGPVQQGGDPVAQQACLPRPEHHLVATTAARYGLDPHVAYGVMWTESAMKPGVTSLAGARGLMQIMPAEVDRLHAEAGLPGPADADRLYRVPYNVVMGVTELGTKAQHLDGVMSPRVLPAVLASYNAGVDPVRRWLSELPSPAPMDGFMERIGYTETRRYVRRVLSWTMRYRWLYGDAGPSGSPRR